MERRYSKQLLLEIFFPENLKETRTYIDDKKSKKKNKWDNNTYPHVEEIEE